MKELGYGAFGIVFELNKSEVLKAFTTVSNSHLESSFNDDININDLKLLKYTCFLNEKKAYMALSKHQNISSYFPRFIKEIDPIEILEGERKKDKVNKIFIKNAGLVLEKIELNNQNEIKYSEFGSAPRLLI